ncbi:MAG: DUF4349 domain-containing protein [Lachnospiraceae bacterium]|nr:DUF4349 domain-containing protein [Lachnospiraceae bacterium]
MSKRKLFAGAALICSVVLAACGSGSKMSEAATDTAGSFEYDNYANYEEAAEEAQLTNYSSVDGEATSTMVEETAQATNRKLIKNVNLEVETKTYDALMKNLEEEVEKIGGYIESMNAYNGSYLYSQKGERHASITARIPAASLDDFVKKVGEEANVTNRSESVEDVTLTYVDMKSHKKMLTEEQERLMELLENAASIDDIIAIESRLSEVRYQIESMESQLRTYDNLVDYSTVQIYIDEVVELTPVEEETAGERIVTGFSRSLHNVIDGIKNFFIELIIAIPYLIVWAVVIVILFFVIRAIMKASEKKTKRLAAERRARMAQTPAEQKTAAKAENTENPGYPYEKKPDNSYDNH